MVGNDKISVAAPKINRNNDEIAWIAEHKAEIIKELTERERIVRERNAEKEKIFMQLKNLNPEMKRNTPLVEKAITRVVDEGWSIESANIEYRSIYADIMDSHF